MLFHLLHREWYYVNSIVLCQIIAFHLKIHLLLPCFIAITDAGLCLVNISLASKCVRKTLQKRGDSGFRVLLLGWLLWNTMTNSELDTQWSSLLACQFWHQPWSTCTQQGFPVRPACTFLPCSLNPVTVDISDPGNQINPAAIQWAMSTTQTKFLDSSFGVSFSKFVPLGDSLSTIGYSLAFSFISSLEVILHK